MAWLAAGVGAVSGECLCVAARAAGGWCPEHRVGYVAGVAIPSEMLFEVLDAHGHDLDLDTFTCPDCRAAIESDGFCAQDRIGFVGGKAYFSYLTYLLGTGELLSEAQLACPVCRENARSHGFCEKCGIGMAGHIAIRGSLEYREIEREILRLEAAAREVERCEQCAVALWVESTCFEHQRSFEGTVPVKAP